MESLRSGRGSFRSCLSAPVVRTLFSGLLQGLLWFVGELVYGAAGPDGARQLHIVVEIDVPLYESSGFPRAWGLRSVGLLLDGLVQGVDFSSFDGA